MDKREREKACVTRRGLLYAGLGLLGLGVCSTLAPVSAEAASWEVVHCDASWSQVPAGTILMNASRFNLWRADGIKVTGDLVLREGLMYAPGYDDEWQSKAVLAPYRSTSAYTVRGTITLTYDSAAVDVNGDLLDVEIYVSNIRFGSARYDRDRDDYVQVVRSQARVGASKNNASLGFSSAFEHNPKGSLGEPPVRLDCRVRLFKAGTRTLADGELSFIMQDLDVMWGEATDFAEGFTFTSGAYRKIYVQRDTHTDVDLAAGGVHAGVVEENDPSTRVTAAFVLCEPDFSFTWQGFHCGSTVMYSTTPDPVDVSVEKTWSGDRNFDKYLPESVTVALVGSDKSRRELKLSAKNGWKGTFEGLPRVSSGRTYVSYDLEEVDAPEHFEARVSGSDDEGFVVTNEFVPPMTTVDVEKVWDSGGSPDLDLYLPDSVTVTLTGSDGSSHELELTAEGGWRGAFGGLYVDDEDGRTIAYELEESPVDDFVSQVTGDQESGFVVTNTLVPGDAGLYKDPKDPSWI